MAEIHYSIGADPNRPRHLKVRLVWHSEGNQTRLRLPQWRPGRYEQGNFTRNLVGLHANHTPMDASHQKQSGLVTVTKTGSSEWILIHSNRAIIEVEYSYFANQADAGACWVDQELLYVNPVHCCLYIPGEEDHACALSIDLGTENSDWTVATALPLGDDGTYHAVSYHELVDSPFLASSSLQNVRWSSHGVNFTLWIQGVPFPKGLEGQRILEKFKAFCSEQIITMGSFPVDSFHFILLALPNSFYHGVEHLRSTVLALGPGHEIWSTLLNELLGVASHELFHAWNIKSIRPAALQPYRYEGLIFSDLGYIYEGFTTYYGDLFLVRSGVLTFEEYLDEVNAYLLRHTLNYGRYNHSLHESSVDTWVDGYSSLHSAPHRRVSIYAEGMLQALHLDLTLRNCSHHTLCLDDLMRFLWLEHLREPSRGYTQKDITDWLQQTLPEPMKWDLYFEKHYAKPMSIEQNLALALTPMGCQLVANPCEDAIQRILGIQMQWNKSLPVVEHTVQGSPAALGGMGPGDRWLAWQTTRTFSSEFIDSGCMTLDPKDIAMLTGIEDPTILQDKAQKILFNVIENNTTSGSAPLELEEMTSNPNSLSLNEDDTLLVLYVNALDHYQIARMKASRDITFYNHFKIVPSSEITAVQMANRNAWISSIQKK